MFERILFDEYKFYCEKRIKIGRYEGFIAQGRHYFFVPTVNFEEKHLNEIVNIARHLQSQGDNKVAIFIPTASSKLTCNIEGQQCILFEIPSNITQVAHSQGVGLALQHYRGKTFQPTNKQHSPSWSQLWISRLTQLEQQYNEVMKKEKKTSVDEAFLTSFPYYLGLTENAIQYFVDSELDLEKFVAPEQKTICFYQISKQERLTLNNNHTPLPIKSPIDFVYDYPSRDIAEFIRTIVIEEQKKSLVSIRKFIKQYEQGDWLSIRSWRNIYSRLLFPIDYFEAIEGYYYYEYFSQGNENFAERLYDILSEEQQRQQFLITFRNQIVPSSMRQYVPELSWLSFPNNRTKK